MLALKFHGEIYNLQKLKYVSAKGFALSQFYGGNLEPNMAMFVILTI